MPPTISSHARMPLITRCFAIVAAMHLLAIGRGHADEPPAAGFEVRDVQVISWKPPLYHGWPTLARRANGELLLAFSGGREAHVCPFGRLELMRSKDGGATWGWPQVLYDGPIDDRDAGIVELPSGTILATTFTSLAYEPLLEQAEKTPGAWDATKLAEWRAAHSRLSPDDRQAELGAWMMRSTDGGRTWSPRYAVPVNSPHGPIVLSNGRALFPGVALWSSPRAVAVYESADDGVSWTHRSDVPLRSGDQMNQYHELHGVEAANGTVILHIRNHNSRNVGETLQCESTDGGRSWTEPHAIGVWGLPSHLLRMKDGRLLMSYGHRRKPFGVQARVSVDHGRTWSGAMRLTEDGSGGDLGYPSTVELNDGSLVTVWYERLAESPLAQLRQARWTLSAAP